MKTLTILGILAAVVGALLMRLKAGQGGARKARLAAAKARLEQGIQDLNRQRADVEAAQASHTAAVEAEKAIQALHDQEKEEPAPTDAAGSKSRVDDELNR